MLVGDSATAGPTPVPDKAIVPLAVPLMVKDPVRIPASDGVNLRMTVQLEPTPIV